MRNINVAVLAFCSLSTFAHADIKNVTQDITQVYCALDDGDGDNSHLSMTVLPGTSQITAEVRYLASMTRDQIVQLSVPLVEFDTNTKSYFFKLAINENIVGQAVIDLRQTNFITGRPKGYIKFNTGFYRNMFSCSIK